MAVSVRLAIGAIVKNEFPYLLEWIAYHKLQGVKKFYIADNNSSDSTSELLMALNNLGEICLIPYPTVGDNPSQLRAYSMMLQKYHRDFDWICFIDADEFIVPTGAVDNFAEFMAEIPDDVGALSLNWSIFGSAGEKNYRDDLTINRFSKRAVQDFHINNHFKSVVSSRARFSAPLNPHRFHLPGCMRFVHSDMSDVMPHETLGIKVSQSVIWDNFRLNHYNIRSSEEFFDRKATRGLADSVRVRNNASFFNQRDRNEVEDSSAKSYVQATNNAVRELIVNLESAGYHYGACGSPNPSRKHEICIERVIVEGGAIRVHGSGFQLESHDPVAEFKVIIGGVDCRVQTVRKRNSRKMHPSLGMDSSCGFDLAASYVGADPKIESIYIRAYDDSLKHYDEVMLRDHQFDTATGYVDNILQSDEDFEIHGWFKLEGGSDLPVKAMVRSGRHEFILEDVVRVDRPDVHSKHPEAQLDCGFTIGLGKKLTAAEVSEAEVYIISGISASHLKKTRKAIEKFSALRG